MAQQKGVIKLEGAVGDLSFYKRQGVYYARSKGGVSGDRIKNDPAFVRTRENQKEFARGCAAGKLLRTSLRELILRSKDSRMTGRLTQVMMKVIHTDATNARGMRTVSNGDIALLQGFEFNRNARLENTLQADFSVTIDRVAGNVELVIPAFVPAQLVVYPEGATHAVIAAGANEVDFDAQSSKSAVERCDVFLLDHSEHPAVNLTVNLSANTDKVVFVVVGIEFYQQVNGVNYPLQNGAYNALALVKADKQ